MYISLFTLSYFMPWQQNICYYQRHKFAKQDKTVTHEQKFTLGNWILRKYNLTPFT